MSKKNKNKIKDIEILKGDGTEIEFSPVFEHLNVAKPKTKSESDKKKKIVIPDVKKNKK